MSKVAFACPVYDMKNHFELAFNLYKSKKLNNITNDFYFVFSDVRQKEKFERIVKEEFPDDNLLYLITTEEINKCNAKAVSKKFFALDMLKSKYDYIILTDCESLFIKECDFAKIAEYIWNNRTMLNANKSPEAYRIMGTCYKVMGIYDNKKLRRDTKNFRYNFWFNEIQVYKCDVLPEFFEWLSKHNKQEVYDEYLCFEYYVFYAFLLLEKDMHIRKFRYESFGGINEYLTRFKKSNQLEILKKMDLHWSSSRDAINDNTVMLFHLDRDANDVNYAPRLTLKVKFLYFKERIKQNIKDVLNYD